MRVKAVKQSPVSAVHFSQYYAYRKLKQNKELNLTRKLRSCFPTKNEEATPG